MTASAPPPAGSGFILNIKFNKDVFNPEEGLNNFIALWKTCFEKGGQQMAVTVVSKEDLEDALIISSTWFMNLRKT
ncbi:MAG: hypothetical protein IJ325_02185 [Clostridia bacterium]|nr:hypothetical protein [Clostridia bacterium]